MRILVLSSTIPLTVLEAVRNIIRAYFLGADLELKSQSLNQWQHDQPHLDQKRAPEKNPQGILPEGVINLNIQGQNDTLSLQAEWYTINEFERVSVTALKPKYRVVINTAECQGIGASKIDRQEPLALLIKHGVYQLLQKVTQRFLPWGILTGIRPTKLIHKMTDLGLTKSEQRQILSQRYLIQLEKSELLLEIVQVQEPFLRDLKQHPEFISVYIGIPFCPSRCSYCSFPGFAVGRGGQELDTYLKALELEIEAVGSLMRERRFLADCVYIGGGTPTILSDKQLERLLSQIHTHLPLTLHPELTVEGGRPETLTETKLSVLRQGKVNRLSINPQTMNEQTLVKVGRSHSVSDIYRSYELARQLGSWTINMDLILGLPGEGLEELETTFSHMQKLHPDNLTVHVLALKKGSRAKEENYRHIDTETAEHMQALAMAKAKAMGYLPYYLYRQKDIAGNLENIGYALPEHICRYNIAIMEERQTIIGIGAGASSKLVVADDYSFINLVHPSDWRMYVERWSEIHQRRILENV